MYRSGFLFSQRTGQECQLREWVVKISRDSLIWAMSDAPAVAPAHVIVSERRNPLDEM